MEKFIKFLEQDVDFNIEVHNKIQDLKDQKLADSSLFVFKCNLKLDIIQLNDQDLNLSVYIQQNYPNLDSLIRDYVLKTLLEDKYLKNITIRQEQILPDIEIINGNLSNSLNIYAQKCILQNSLKQDSLMQGQLVLIEYFQVLKIYPLENYYSIKRYSYSCNCNNDYKLYNTNLILHIIENNQSSSFNKQNSNLIKNLSCDLCHQEMYEDKEKSKLELCQKVLIYIPERNYLARSNSFSGFEKQEGKLVEMFVEKQYCNSLSLNQTYSCIAYYSLATSNRQTKNDFLTGFKPLNVTEYLFACTISINVKDVNDQFNQQLINQVSLFDCIALQEQTQSQMKQNCNEENQNFHFQFKQLMFAVDSFFNESAKFSFLQLKTALVMSYVLANSNKILKNNFNIQDQFSQLNIHFQCESQFVDGIIEEVLMNFGQIQSFNVFDCLFQSDIASSLIKSNNSILLIKNIQDISKQQSEQLSKILQNQEIYFDQLKTKLNLNVTIWAFSSSNKLSSKINKFKNEKNIFQSFEQYFDVCLCQDKSVLSLKDYHLLIQNQIDTYLEKELSRDQKWSKKAHHELSTEKKNKYSKSHQFNEQMSTLKKEKSILDQRGQVQVENGQHNYEQEEEEAYCLLNKFINTVRNCVSVKDTNYSTSNISSLSKFAVASSIFRNVFIKNNSQQLLSCTENSRVVINTFDAFLSIFFNILSRKLFCRELDTKYFLSFIVNYGSGYQENSEMRIPQEKEFFIALQKIQDQILDFIRF
ncbi:hypothetical protein ABPG74_021079 [Tetrahymena malaccensis]